MASSMYDPEHELHDLVFFNDEKDCVLLWACKARRGTRPTLYFLIFIDEKGFKPLWSYKHTCCRKNLKIRKNFLVIIKFKMSKYQGAS